MTRDERIEVIHKVMHPFSGRTWIECDKFWCIDYIPAFVDGDLILPVECPGAGVGEETP